MIDEKRLYVCRKCKDIFELEGEHEDGPCERCLDGTLTNTGEVSSRMNAAYRRKGPNDLNLPKRIMRFIVDNVMPVKGGHGRITLSCDALWNMTDEEFEETFGVKCQDER